MLSCLQRDGEVYEWEGELKGEHQNILKILKHETTKYINVIDEKFETSNCSIRYSIQQTFISAA